MLRPAHANPNRFGFQSTFQGPDGRWTSHQHARIDGREVIFYGTADTKEAACQVAHVNLRAASGFFDRDPESLAAA